MGGLWRWGILYGASLHAVLPALGFLGRGVRWSGEWFGTDAGTWIVLGLGVAGLALAIRLGMRITTRRDAWSVPAAMYVGLLAAPAVALPLGLIGAGGLEFLLLGGRYLPLLTVVALPGLVVGGAAGWLQRRRGVSLRRIPSWSWRWPMAGVLLVFAVVTSFWTGPALVLIPAMAVNAAWSWGLSAPAHSRRDAGVMGAIAATLSLAALLYRAESVVFDTQRLGLDAVLGVVVHLLAFGLFGAMTAGALLLSARTGGRVEPVSGPIAPGPAPPEKVTA